jgi:flagellar L-ring protein precursor FlgH
MKWTRILVMVLLSLDALLAQANAQSALIGARTAKTAPAESALIHRSLFSVTRPKPKEPKIHDLITVIVKDESSYSSDGSHDAEKKLEVDGQIDSWVRFHNYNSVVPLSLEGGNPAIKGELSAANERSGKAKRKDKVLARITARIIDVKPNGTCVLEARKSIQADEERISMTLTGMCRRQDITAANTVLSDQIYDLSVVAKYGGGVKDSTRKGWLTRLVEFLSPF